MCVSASLHGGRRRRRRRQRQTDRQTKIRHTVADAHKQGSQETAAENGEETEIEREKKRKRKGKQTGVIKGKVSCLSPLVLLLEGFISSHSGAPDDGHSGIDNTHPPGPLIAFQPGKSNIQLLMFPEPFSMPGSASNPNTR